ncbi:MULTISPECIES: YckD family protein [Bacillus]|uniref:YckD family protein n=1 Tax=Bacillus TaxID=1386 RepID=UPI000B9BD539|nr:MULTISPECIES: YckD family protein [Bacillus]MCK6205847.1 YckD family protein [Bacillus infantis]OXT17091.1 hypothetical protein B9K06_12055 [Bacillus sp. OG2]PLR71925.1 DUF2680 domain-containing protein [Bacillus sp. UMB0728]
MIKKLSIVLLCALFLGQAAGMVQAEGTDSGQRKQLTEEQVKEIEALQADVLEARKKVIMKYADFGAITADQAQEMVKHLEKRHEKMKEEGFMPHWLNRKHCPHCH